MSADGRGKGHKVEGGTGGGADKDASEEEGGAAALELVHGLPLEQDQRRAEPVLPLRHLRACVRARVRA